MTTNSAPLGRVGILPERKRAGRLHYNWYIPYLFLLPGLILYLLWTVYPLLYELYISFFDWKIMPGQTSTFIGVDNYLQAFNDKLFWLALTNTLQYTLVTVVGQLLFGLGAALLVHRVFFAKRLFRAIYYLPVVTSWVVVSFLFQYLFSPTAGGLVNYVLMNVLHVTSQPISWMRETNTAWIIIYSLGIWKGIGWAMVIFLAALQSVPIELYEAAAIDGAGEGGQFRYITLPMIRKATVFVLVALTIGGFQVFISVFLITAGGPAHRTEVMLSYMYNRGFGDRAFGYGAAISYILTAFIAFFSFVQMRAFNKPTE